MSLSFPSNPKPRTILLPEHHGLGWLGPRHVLVGAPLPGRDVHAVLQLALVEGVGGELRQGRVHAVLHLQAQGVVAEEDEALEKGLSKARFGSLRGGIEGNVGGEGCMLGVCWNRGVSAGVEWAGRGALLN